MTITPETQMVQEFHEAFGCHVADKPGFPEGLFNCEDTIPLLAYYASELMSIAQDLKYVAAKQNGVGNKALGLILVRLQLQVEETAELADAIGNGDLPNALKELSDIGYVTRGTHLTLGLHHLEQSALRITHTSNMSKLDDDGKPVIHESGRVVKGVNYQDPKQLMIDLVERARVS